MQKETIKNIIITLVAALILFYFMLPPINIMSPSFWFFLISLVIIYLTLTFMSSFNYYQKLTRLPHYFKIVVGSIGGVILLIILINIFMSPLFQANSYSERITIQEDGNFIEDVALVDFNSLPLLDKDSSQKLGDRVMGQMPELVSQFQVSNLYTQINYNNDIIRVTPLEYNGIIKYFTNRGNGVKGYITVNSVTGEANLTKLDKGMKYMPSAYFFENVDRYLRFKYPFEIFDEKHFELDNEGNPYWIIPTIKYKGIGLRKEIKGIVILDPITGKTEKYSIKNIPTWVDHVYSPELIIEQVDDWGKYREGFFNSIFGQKNVVATTDGYNYTVMNDDVYLYTGITSVANDESNLGFILTNMRTKETNFYSVPGAEEYSAMASAEGQVQQMKYEATFPLLINLNNRPTYLISLKDNAGLVKMYAFVDVTNYQKVVVTDASLGIEQAAFNYLDGMDISIDNENTMKKDIVVSDIKTAIIDGNTYYYLKDSENKKYRLSIKVNPLTIPFIEKGTKIKISYLKEDDITDIIKVE